MDFYLAIIKFRNKEFSECINLCSDILRKNPLDKAVWSLKTRSLVEEVRIDYLEVFDDGIAESIFSEDRIATSARPGTSLLSVPSSSGRDRPTTNSGISPSIRPITQSGRPLSGIQRPMSSSNGNRATSANIDSALRSRVTTARPISASSGRHVRLASASIQSDPNTFINTSRLNLTKYGSDECISKALFQYLFYVENDLKRCLELALIAQKHAEKKNGDGKGDWWWGFQIGLCWLRLGQIRNAEKYFRESISIEPMLIGFIGSIKVCLKLDQPLAALEVCKKGLEKFPKDTQLLIEMARIEEALSNPIQSVKYYKEVLSQDSSNIEAIACIGMHHFYSDQPEVALRFYRRLLQMGVYTSELFVNLGLCCFYSQQYDMTLICFQRAFSIATKENVSEIWYNLGHIALGLCDTIWAGQCFRLAISYNQSHGESYNNLGVLEARRGKTDVAIAFFQTASAIASYMFEPLFNHAKISDSIGDLEKAYLIVQKSLLVYPEHADSKILFTKLCKYFQGL